MSAYTFRRLKEEVVKKQQTAQTEQKPKKKATKKPKK